MIFGNDTPRYCAFCEHGKDLNTNDEMSCIFRGIVDRADTCRKFRYDALKRNPKAKCTETHFEEKEFTLQD